MILAKIAGSVISSTRSDNIDGAVYFLVEPCSPSGVPDGSVLVALDLVGASPDEFVLISQGSSVRQTDITKDKPLDAVIIGIVDIVENGGKVVFQK